MKQILSSRYTGFFIYVIAYMYLGVIPLRRFRASDWGIFSVLVEGFSPFGGFAGGMGPKALGIRFPGSRHHLPQSVMKFFYSIREFFPCQTKKKRSSIYVKRNYCNLLNDTLLYTIFSKVNIFCFSYFFVFSKVIEDLTLSLTMRKKFYFLKI